MKIDNVKIENIFGVQSIDAEIAKPITVFAGPNGAGKSSISNAIKMTMFGDVSRVKLKKDYSSVVRDGQKKGFAAVNGEGIACRFSIPGTQNTPPLEYPALPYLLDPHLFASLDNQKRKTFLSHLCGVKTSNDVVKAKMLAKGCSAEKTERILPMLRSGFQAACDSAKESASQARGSWKAVTGETYGSKKADDWIAPEPELKADQKAVDKAEKKLSIANGSIAELNQKLGQLTQQKNAFESEQATVEKLRNVPALTEAQEKHLAELMDESVLLKKEIEQLKQKCGQVPATDDHLKCPHCDGLVTMGETSLLPYTRPVFDKSVADQIPAKQIKYDELFAAGEDLCNLRKAKEHADYALANRPEVTPVDKTAINAINEDLLSLHETRQRTQEEIRRLREAVKQTDMARDADKRASAFHRDVYEWSLIAEALSPDGIPGEMLADAIRPANERLAASSDETGWKQVVITPAMDIEAAGRPYNLLSESEQWRTDAIIAEAISYISGLKFLALDRFDVLDLAARKELFEWLINLDADLDTALLFGTLKKPIPNNDYLDCHWVEGGEITGWVNPDMEQAA